MDATNTATLAFRIYLKLKEMSRAAARWEHRSITNMVEVLIRDYCEHEGMAIPDSKTTSQT